MLSGYGVDADSSTSRPTWALVVAADFVIGKSVSEEYRLSYKKFVQCYHQFIYDEIKKTANPLPPSLYRVVLYIAQSFTKGCSSTNANTYCRIGLHFPARRIPKYHSKLCRENTAATFHQIKTQSRSKTTHYSAHYVKNYIRHSSCSKFSLLDLVTSSKVFPLILRFPSSGRNNKTRKANQHYVLGKHLTLVTSLPIEN